MNDERKLRLVFLQRAGRPKSYSFLIGAFSVEDSIKKSVDEMHSVLSNHYMDSEMLRFWNDMKLGNNLTLFLKIALTILLYVCAKNAVITPSVELISNVLQKKSKSASEWDVKKWYVGFGVAALHDIGFQRRTAKCQFQIVESREQFRSKRNDLSIRNAAMSWDKMQQCLGTGRLCGFHL